MNYRIIKLNNHGWGLKEMLIMNSILIILLLLASYYVYVLYNNLDVRKGTQYYKLESALQVAAVRYVNSKNMLNSKGIVRLYDLQKEGYINSFDDSNGNSCDGYVVYNNDDYKSYISCEFYTSKNYNKNNK